MLAGNKLYSVRVSLSFAVFLLVFGPTYFQTIVLAAPHEQSIQSYPTTKLNRPGHGHSILPSSTHYSHRQVQDFPGIHVRAGSRKLTQLPDQHPPNDKNASEATLFNHNQDAEPYKPDHEQPMPLQDSKQVQQQEKQNSAAEQVNSNPSQNSQPYIPNDENFQQQAQHQLQNDGIQNHQGSSSDSADPRPPLQQHDLSVNDKISVQRTESSLNAQHERLGDQSVRSQLDRSQNNIATSDTAIKPDKFNERQVLADENIQPEAEESVSQHRGIPLKFHLNVDQNMSKWENRLKQEHEKLLQNMASIREYEQELQQKLNILARVNALQKKHEEENRQIQDLHFQESEAYRVRSKSKNQESALREEIQALAQENNQTEQQIQLVHAEAYNIEKNYSRLMTDLALFNEGQQYLKEQEARLLAKLRVLSAKFYEHGMSEWLHLHLQSVHPLIHDSIRATMDALEPVADSVESFVQFDEDLAEKIGGGDEFVIGTLFYVVLLVPIASTFWLLNRANRLISAFTIEQYVSVLSIHFLIFSTTCFAMSLYAHDDVLRHVSRATLSVRHIIILGNVMLLLVHVTLQLLITSKRRLSTDFAQLCIASLVLFHFSLRFVDPPVVTWMQTIDGGMWAYLLYTAAYALILFCRRNFLTSLRPKYWIPFFKHHGLTSLIS